MFLVGLTGGIAAGKSTVSTLWESLGAEVVDADVLAREVVEPGSEGLGLLVELLGDSILNKDGTLNRERLAAVIFADPSMRMRVENVLHPLIKQLALKAVTDSQADVLVYVIPLLVESNSDLPFDFVVTVEAPESDQVSRLVGTRGMSEAQARARISSQANPADRANRSDVILSSNQSRELLLKDATQLWSRIEKLAAEKKSND
ncbi:MAG: hypothetical protein RIS26_812 [Actinomycetota bacterium]|jgi:dephospho-CoA kinase